MDIAALLIKFNTCVNATDKWAFTPLHEAAQKGRTQLCALLLAHGADPTMKNQEGQTPLDLATVMSLEDTFHMDIKAHIYKLPFIKQSYRFACQNIDQFKPNIYKSFMLCRTICSGCKISYGSGGIDNPEKLGHLSSKHIS